VTTKTSPLKAADDLFSRMVRDRDGMCMACGANVGLQCAHIWSRRYRSLRWRLENAITLCRGCHMGFTHHPAEFGAWCDDRRFCENGICTDHGAHMFGAYTYLQLRHRALNDPSERPSEALARLRVTVPLNNEPEKAGDALARLRLLHSEGG